MRKGYSFFVLFIFCLIFCSISRAEMALAACGHEAGHDYDTPVITREASYSETGIKTYTCKSCGHIYNKVLPVKKLAAPVNFRYENLERTVKLSWNAVKGAEWYVIYRNNKKIGASQTTVYYDSSMDFYDVNSYTVVALAGDNHSERSETLRVWWLGKAPKPWVSNTSSCIAFSWDVNSRSYLIADGMLVYRYYNGSVKVTDVKFSDTSKTYYQDFNVSNGCRYEYRIKMYKDYEGIRYCSAFSDRGASLRISPTKVISVASTSQGMSIVWEKNDCADKYLVYRSINGSDFKKITEITDAAIISFVDTEAKKNGFRYEYRIKVEMDYNNTTYHSAAITAKAGYYISRPVIRTAVNNAEKAIEVAWSENIKADGYRLKFEGSDGSVKTYTVGKVLNKKGVCLKKGVTYTVTVAAFIKNDRYYYSESSLIRKVTVKI